MLEQEKKKKIYNHILQMGQFLACEEDINSFGFGKRKHKEYNIKSITKSRQKGKKMKAIFVHKKTKKTAHCTQRNEMMFLGLWQLFLLTLTTSIL